MRTGFTTGSCAAASAKAAAYMLLSGREKENISIETPANIVYSPQIINITRENDYVSCGVIKDAGDDPDITDKALICAKVSLCEKQNEQVIVTGGIGVGIVTRPGLEMPIGEYAINSTPRSMIKKEVTEVMELFDYRGGLLVEIYVPEGEALATKTFNPHMGIENGISILGTTGIVEPMSVDALLKTIRLDLVQKKAEGVEVAVMVPGNYGVNFLVANYGLDEKKIVQFSNYIGSAIDMAVEVGFKKILIVGHTGKLVKVSGGIMNTHSKEADSRLELMTAALIEACHQKNIDLSISFLNTILEQVTTTAAIEILDKAGLLHITCDRLVEKILIHLRKRIPLDVQLECILYENSFGLLSCSEGAKECI